MSVDLFRPVEGSMIRYFVRPNDSFVLHSLEKLDVDAYLYRLLRDEGYERIFFIEIDELKCSVWTFDQFSFLSTSKPVDFRSVNMEDDASVRAACEQAAGEGGGEKPGPKLKTLKRPTSSGGKKAAPKLGRSQLQTFSSEEEFRAFMENRISPALNADNIRSAVVIPMELFEKRGFLAETTVATIRYAQKHNDSKLSTIVLTTTRRDNLINCLRFPDLHYWVNTAMYQNNAGQGQVDALINVLRGEGILVLADGICADEIANLLLRRKLIEEDSRLDALPVSKIYGLAERLCEHCRMEKNHFKTIRQFRMHDYIRQLDRILDSDRVVEELLQVAEELRGRETVPTEQLNPLALERVTGQSVSRCRVSVEEQQQEFRTAMTALDELVGLSSVKDTIRRRLNTVRVYGDTEGPGHYIFTGNPGTGKSEVARLMGNIFKAMGLLKKGHLVECKKTDLVADHVGGSSIKTRGQCEAALDGVLFVDEAYELVNTNPTGPKFKTAFDEEAYTELLTFMENNRQRVCVIFAGYPEHMRAFRQANPGMSSRIGKSNVIHFPDYNTAELFDILSMFARKGNFTFTPEYAAQIRKVITRLAKGKSEDFGNGRTMRELFLRSKECAAGRVSATGDENAKYVFTAADVPEEYLSNASESDFALAMADLERLIGLESVKSTVRSLMDSKLIYPDDLGPGHYVFAGNPGTGKSEVARIMGRLFKAMGLLSSGHCVECRKADLVSEYQGETSKLTRGRCEAALDGVLFVDEAYELVNTEPTGQKFCSKADEEAYTELMAFMENNRHRICVIVAGYPDLMEKFLDANDGTRSRITDVIPFPDYSDAELVDILKMMAQNEGFTLTPEAAEAVRKTFRVRRKECRGKFSNAREVRNLLRKFKQNCASRMRQLQQNGRTEEMEQQKYTLTADDMAVGSMREQRKDSGDALAELDELIGLAEVKEHVRSLVNSVLFPVNPDQTPEPGHYVFAGNPGTGKTEVARLMGKALHAAGVLTTDRVVEVSRGDLVAGFEGQTAIRALDRCKEALGGVLFIDEAYTLFSRSNGVDFGKEALEAIMKFMEDNRQRMCVIFAGYEDKMDQLMDVNDGFRSRITDVVRFPDYSLPELMEILQLMGRKRGVTFEEVFCSKAERILDAMRKQPKFSNARDVRKLLEAAVKKRGNRLAEAYRQGASLQQLDMDLLLPEDLPGAPEPEKKPVYHRIDAAPIRELRPPYEAVADRVSLGKETDPCVLYIETDQGQGTAFLISPEGYALTCHHVIEGAQKIRARFRMKGRPGGADTWHDCQVVNTHPRLDMALLRLEGCDFPFLPLAGEDRTIEKGEEFILSGYPFGDRLEKDLTTFNGFVASTDMQIDEYGLMRYNINSEAKRGNSGAPVIALSDGRVLGVLAGSVTVQASQTHTEEINYMRPVSYFWEMFTK